MRRQRAAPPAAAGGGAAAAALPPRGVMWEFQREEGGWVEFAAADMAVLEDMITRPSWGGNRVSGFTTTRLGIGTWN
eukprot:gene8375-6508_t